MLTHARAEHSTKPPPMGTPLSLLASPAHDATTRGRPTWRILSPLESPSCGTSRTVLAPKWESRSTRSFGTARCRKYGIRTNCLPASLSTCEMHLASPALIHLSHTAEATLFSNSEYIRARLARWRVDEAAHLRAEAKAGPLQASAIVAPPHHHK